MVYQITATLAPVSLAELARLPITLPNGVEIGIAGGHPEGGIRLYTKRRIDLSAHPLPRIDRTEDGSAQISFPINPDRSDLLAPFHFIEAFGHLILGIERVDWLACTEEWLPESDEEKALLHLGKVRRQEHDFGPPSKMLQSATLDGLLHDYAALEELTLPLSILKSANDAYRHRRYYEAFFYFYLYLEGMYANGQSRVRQVIDAFAASPAMRIAADQVLVNLTTPHSDSHLARARSLLSEFRCEWSTQGLLELMVRLRGSMFHFNPRSPRRGVNPLRPHEMTTPAYLAMMLATLTAMLEISSRATPPLGDRIT